MQINRSLFDSFGSPIKWTALFLLLFLFLFLLTKILDSLVSLNFSLDNLFLLLGTTALFLSAMILVIYRRYKIAFNQRIALENAKLQLLLEIVRRLNQLSSQCRDNIQALIEQACSLFAINTISVWLFDDKQQYVEKWNEFGIPTKTSQLTGNQITKDLLPDYIRVALSEREPNKKLSGFAQEKVIKDEFFGLISSKLDRTQRSFVVSIDGDKGCMGFVHAEIEKQSQQALIDYAKVLEYIASAIESYITQSNLFQSKERLSHQKDKFHLMTQLSLSINYGAKPESVIKQITSLLSVFFVNNRISYLRVSSQGVADVIASVSDCSLIAFSLRELNFLKETDLLEKLFLNQSVLIRYKETPLENVAKIYQGSDERVKAVVAFPIRKHDNNTDIIYFECEEDNWDGEKSELISSQISIIALLINNSVLRHVKDLSVAQSDTRVERLEQIRERRENRLRHRVEMETIVSRISSRFINLTTERYGEIIERSLKEIGEYFGAQRCNLFEVKADEISVVKSYEWICPGVGDAIKKDTLFRLDTFPWIYQQLKEGSLVYFDHPSMLPAAAEKDKSLLKKVQCQSFVLIPIFYQSHLSCILNVSTKNVPGYWTPDELNILQLTANIFTNVIHRKRYEEKLSITQKKLVASNKKLMSLISIDGLTRIANRREFDRRLKSEINRAKRDNQPISLILFDVDNFKHFNDQYGHLSGDRCLKRVAKVIAKNCQRANELAARYGGEEFAVILGNTDENDACLLANRIRKDVEMLGITASAVSEYDFVTVSGGLVSSVPDLNDMPQKIIELADKALYKAKANGRNSIEVIQKKNIYPLKNHSF